MIFNMIMNNHSYELEDFRFKAILIIGILISYYVGKYLVYGRGDKNG